MHYTKKAELHCHANRRQRVFYFPLLYDSVTTESEIIDKCTKEDIKILSITDHDSLDGYYNAKRIIEKNKLDILLVSGCEISTKDGHVLAYGIKKKILKNLSVNKTIEKIHEQNGVAVAPHPFMLLGLGNKIFENSFDAIEVFNSMIPTVSNRLCELKTKNLNIPKMVGSDAHQFQNVGNSTLLFSEKILKEKQVLDSIKNGNFAIGSKKPSPAITYIRHMFYNIKVQLLDSINHA